MNRLQYSSATLYEIRDSNVSIPQQDPFIKQICDRVNEINKPGPTSQSVLKAHEYEFKPPVVTAQPQYLYHFYYSFEEKPTATLPYPRSQKQTSKSWTRNRAQNESSQNEDHSFSRTNPSFSRKLQSSSFLGSELQPFDNIDDTDGDDLWFSPNDETLDLTDTSLEAFTDERKQQTLASSRNLSSSHSDKSASSFGQEGIFRSANLDDDDIIIQQEEDVITDINQFRKSILEKQQTKSTKSHALGESISSDFASLGGDFDSTPTDLFSTLSSLQSQVNTLSSNPPRSPSQIPALPGNQLPMSSNSSLYNRDPRTQMGSFQPSHSHIPFQPVSVDGQKSHIKYYYQNMSNPQSRQHARTQVRPPNLVEHSFVPRPNPPPQHLQNSSVPEAKSVQNTSQQLSHRPGIQNPNYHYPVPPQHQHQPSQGYYSQHRPQLIPHSDSMVPSVPSQPGHPTQGRHHMQSQQHYQHMQMRQPHKPVSHLQQKSVHPPVQRAHPSSQAQSSPYSNVYGGDNQYSDSSYKKPVQPSVQPSTSKPQFLDVSQFESNLFGNPSRDTPKKNIASSSSSSNTPFEASLFGQPSTAVQPALREAQHKFSTPPQHPVVHSNHRNQFTDTNRSRYHPQQKPTHRQEYNTRGMNNYNNQRRGSSKVHSNSNNYHRSYRGTRNSGAQYQSRHSQPSSPPSPPTTTRVQNKHGFHSNHTSNRRYNH